MLARLKQNGGFVLLDFILLNEKVPCKIVSHFPLYVYAIFRLKFELVIILNSTIIKGILL